MAGPGRELVEDMAEWLDGRLVSGLYAAVSIPTERLRGRLRRSGRPFHDPMAPSRCTSEEVEATATWVIAQSRASATLLGGFAGLGGAASVPPEAAATAVALVRLAQKLAVVYGFDPETDRGSMALWRALAAGLDLELPEGGPLGVRVRDLPRVVGRQVPAQASVAMTRAVLRQSAWLVMGRITRLLPVVSSGFAAASARRRTNKIGDRMRTVYRQLAEAAPPDPGLLSDAVEVRAG